MRRLTLALLCATYLCLSLIVALTLWRNGGGWGAGVAALVGGLGLCFAFHGLIERALDTGAVKGEIAAVREAHSILIDQVERLDARLSGVVAATNADQRRSEELIDEVHMLEDLVQRMQQRLDETPGAGPPASATTSRTRAPFQVAVLMSSQPNGASSHLVTKLLMHSTVFWTSTCGRFLRLR